MTKPTAFIIEHCPQVTTFYTRALQQQFDLEIFQSGPPALLRLSKVTPSLIVLGSNLRQLSTEVVYDLIRANVRLAHVPVILLVDDQEHGVPTEVVAKEDIPLLKAMGLGTGGQTLYLWDDIVPHYVSYN